MQICLPVYLPFCVGLAVPPSHLHNSPKMTNRICCDHLKIAIPSKETSVRSTSPSVLSFLCSASTKTHEYKRWAHLVEKLGCVNRPPGDAVVLENGPVKRSPLVSLVVNKQAPNLRSHRTRLHSTCSLVCFFFVPYRVLRVTLEHEDL